MAQKNRGFRLPSNEEFIQMYGKKPAERESNVDPINKKTETGEAMIFDFGMDVSGSMGKFYDTLVDCFNNIMIPGLLGGAERYKSAMRVGGFIFSDDIIPLWDKFREISKLGNSPFKRSAIDQVRPDGMTALYRAMILGLKYTARAVGKMIEGTNAKPKARVCILTDGANNLEPKDASEVRKITRLIKNQREFQTVLVYFNTDGGLSRNGFESMAIETGFMETYYFDLQQGKTDEEKKQLFRNYFDVFSKKQSRN